MADGKGFRCPACATRCTNVYERAVMAVQRKLNRTTGAVGAFVARRPVLVVVLSILATAAAGAGWARFSIESAADKLWVPQDSQAMKDGDWISENYVSGGGYAQVLGSVLSNRKSQYGSNALQLSVFWELFQVDAAVRAITVTAGGRTYKWTDMCETDFGGNCKYTGPLNLWSMNFTEYLTHVNGSSTDPTVGNRNALIQAVNQAKFPDETAVSTLSIFGGLVLSPLSSPAPGRPPLYLSSAEAVSLPYSLRSSLDSDVEDKFYEKFLDILEDWTSKAQYTSLAYIFGSSVSDEIGRSVTNDLYLIIISVALFILVAVVGLSRCHLVGTRSSLALLGVVSSVLAMIAGYGLSLLFGCPFNTLSQTLPYVLLGLSVDCMFILVKAYDGAVAAAAAGGPSGGGGGSLEFRFRSLLSSAGSSVIVTLLASAVAFALGAVSELPAVQWFSAYAALGVVCILIATLTFFTGVFVLTERRISANRLDCCCCVTSGGPPLPSAATALYCWEDSRNAEDSTTTTTNNNNNNNTSGAKTSAQQHQQEVVMAVVVSAPTAQTAAGPWVYPPPQQQVPPARAGGVAGGPPLAVAAEGGGGPADPAGTRQTDLALHAAAAGASPSTTTSDPNLLKLLFGRYYAPLLAKWYVKVLVLAVFIGWAVLCGVGIPRLKEGQPLSELAPDDSYLQDYVAITKDTFQQQIGNPAFLYFRGVDPSSPQQQANMLRALGRTLDNRFVNSTVSAFQGNWLIDFIKWVETTQSDVALVPLAGCSNPYLGRVSGDLGKFVQPHNITGCVPQDRFYPLISLFLGARRGYLDDILWTRSGEELWSSRMPVVHAAAGDNGAYGRELITSIRKLEEGINGDIYGAENALAPGSVFFMYNDNYVYDSGDAILGTMTMEYVLLAVAGVGVVLALTLPSLRAVVLMMISVGLVDYFLFGQMFILDLRFNQVSIINMIMATGLSVDYSVYFAQRFVQVVADGTLNGRMVAAMADTGSAVFAGGITALIGTIPLAFSTSTILRVFFSLIFGTICFALLVGLMLMPVVFSLVGPPPLGPAQGTTNSSSSSSTALGDREDREGKGGDAA